MENEQYVEINMLVNNQGIQESESKIKNLQISKNGNNIPNLWDVVKSSSKREVYCNKDLH